MKKIINGILYNTETAKELAEWSNGLSSSDFSNETETLYRKKNGQLFLYGSGGPLSEYAVSYMQSWTSGEDIKPLTPLTRYKLKEISLVTGKFYEPLLTSWIQVSTLSTKELRHATS